MSHLSDFAGVFLAKFCIWGSYYPDYCMFACAVTEGFISCHFSQD